MDQIVYNKKLHNKLGAGYNAKHGEILNDIEQKRLREALTQARSFLPDGDGRLKAMDYGCGTGNLTSHLVDLGFDVYSADISSVFLNHVKSQFPTAQSILLNGKDLSNVEDDTFDLVATYSVMHHVPDYLAIIREFCRVTKPGGLVYIDHEGSPDVWKQIPEYVALKAKYKRRFSIKCLLSPKWYIKRIRKTINPKYQEEGDIHVWPDDHIEWDQIANVLVECGLEIIVTDDYLLYYSEYDREEYFRLKDRVNDCRLVIARKPIG